MRNFSRLVDCSTAAFLVVVLFGSLSCNSPGLNQMVRAYRYFETPDPFDAWSVKIGQWQSSQQTDGPPQPPATPEDDLRSQYFQIRAELRVDMARRLAAWIQKEAKRVYAEDSSVDHWPTLNQVLTSKGDDCDGLELMVHQLLLDLGFPKNRVYRAVVYRPAEDQYHMVTLWFENPDDPWVIDPTGAMVLGMPRMSEIPDWVPLKLFSETEEFSVRHASSSP
jgi:hypothetical protein